eukprot:3755183-Pleurochrysis_carterae.AAC.1
MELLAINSGHNEQHRKEHDAEQDFAYGIEPKARRTLEFLTALNIDASSTQDHQFDIPVQKRLACELMKSSEQGQKWASKMTGIMAAGVGMITYATCFGLGSGPQLTCTTLYLTLLVVAKELGR